MSYGKAKSAFNGPEPWCSRANSPLRPEVPSIPYKWDTNDPSQLPSNVAKLRAIQHLSLTSVKAASYDEASSGPLRPGFPFYKTLASPPMLLELNMPATIYVKQRKVFMLTTDPKTGILKKTVPDFQGIEEKLQFIKNFVNICVQASYSPVGRRKITSEGGAPRYDLGDSIATRVVAVVKTLDNTDDYDHVVTRTLLLNTLGLQAYLQLALDGDQLVDELVIQQYIKPKGKTANFFRVFWQRIPGSKSTVVGYNLANTKANTPVDKQPVILPNALLINTRYHDVHNNESTDGDKLQQGQEELVTKMAALVPKMTNKGDRNHGGSFSRADGDSEDVRTQVSAEANHGDRSISLETHSINEAKASKAPACIDGGNDERGEDDMYMELHTTAEAIDQKLLRLLRDDVWTYSNDTPRPSGLFLEEPEREAAIKVSRDLDKFQSSTALCSLSVHHGEGDLVSRVQFDRVTSNAMPGVQDTIDKLAIWIGHAMSKKEDLSIIPQELICDFVRDEQGAFYFLQLKGFKLDEPSIQRCVAWAKVMNECGGYIDDSDDGDQNSNDDDNDIDGRMDPKEKWKMRFGHKRLTLSELTNKLREETGDECKLCGCSYVTGQVTSVGKGGVLGVYKHQEDGNFRTSTVGFKENRENDGKEIPVFGYNMSVKQACEVLEVYRDLSYPLTKYARAVLVGYAKTIDVTVASASRVDENDDGNGESISYLDDLPKTRPVGAIRACFVCAEILKETKNKALTAEKFSSLLGIPTSSKQPPQKEKGHDKAFIYHLSHIPRTAVQWRMLVMAHYISDIKLPRSHDLYGAEGCISYTLGHRRSNLMFRVVSDNNVSEMHSVCIVKQCRLHYMCGSVDDVRELFGSKDIDLKISFTKRKKRNENDDDDDGIGGRYLRHTRMLHEILNNRSDDKGKVENSGSHEVALRKIRLDRLKFRDMNALEDHTYDGYFDINDSEKGVWGSDKVDILLPVKPLGPNASLKLSVAVVSDDEFHQRLVDTKFWKEGNGVYWPEPWYHDDQPLPVSWINMLSPGGIDVSSEDVTTTHGQQSSTSPQAVTSTSPQAVTSSPTGLSHLRSKEVMALRENVSTRILKKTPPKSNEQDDSKEAENIENKEVDEAVERGKLLDCVAGELRRKTMVGKLFGRFQEAVKYEGLSEHHELLAVNKDMTLTGTETHYEDLDTSTPGYRRRIVNAVADLSENFKGTMLDLRHRPDVEIKRIRDMNEAAKEHRAKEMYMRKRRQTISPGFVGGKIVAGDSEDDEDDKDLVYTINGKTDGDMYRKDHNSIGKTNVPPLNKMSDDNVGDDDDDDDDDEFRALSKTLEDSIASTRSFQLDSGRQTLDPVPVRVFPTVEKGIPDSARVSSMHRKTRRFTYFMSLYRQLAGNSDNLDVFSMKRLLIDQQNKLMRLIDFYRENRADLPMIKRQYEHDLSLMVHQDGNKKDPVSTCNPVLALMCVHLLKHSPKLRSLMSIYKREGRAVLNQVGFFTAAEECFQLVENRLFYEKRAEKGSILEQLITVCRLRLSKTSVLEEREQAVGHETAVFLRCDFHGECAFYASDLFCQECDANYAQLED